MSLTRRGITRIQRVLAARGVRAAAIIRVQRCNCRAISSPACSPLSLRCNRVVPPSLAGVQPSSEGGGSVGVTEGGLIGPTTLDRSKTTGQIPRRGCFDSIRSVSVSRRERAEDERNFPLPFPFSSPCPRCDHFFLTASSWRLGGRLLSSKLSSLILADVSSGPIVNSDSSWESFDSRVAILMP